jgi:hypothetical protein
MAENNFHTPTEFERQLCRVQGKMFILSAKKNLSSKEFIDSYMQSQTASFFDLPYDRTQWMGEENLLYDIMEENKNLSQGKVYDSESLFWIGYIYRYWHFLTKQGSAEISQKCNAETMHALYPAYHTLDCTQAIERILEA